MRQDNVVKGLRSVSSHVSDLLRARLINTPRRAAAFGLVAAIGTGALLMSAPHDRANAEPANAAVTRRSAAKDSTVTRMQARRPMPKALRAKALTPAPNAIAIQPIAGLNSIQMKNAITIVRAGQELGISERGQIVALSTAMQESNLYNRASHVVPESLQYAHEGYGADHDSVGLFQQRYTTGWGTVKSIMDPAESAKKFYRALNHVDGWQKLPVTVAAQTVQGSAFPDAYAKHQGNATAVVKAVHATR